MAKTRSRQQRNGSKRRSARRRVGYAVVGLRYITQAAVLPAFAHAKCNSRLVAFDEANLRAAELVQSGALGKPRIFSSLFTMQVQPGDIRLQRELGGGTLYDIGIYCINAARALFRDEPTKVAAIAVSNGDRRFREVDEMTSAVLEFPRDRLASFTSS